MYYSLYFMMISKFNPNSLLTSFIYIPQFVMLVTLCAKHIRILLLTPCLSTVELVPSLCTVYGILNGFFKKMVLKEDPSASVLKRVTLEKWIVKSVQKQEHIVLKTLHINSFFSIFFLVSLSQQRASWKSTATLQTPVRQFQ